MFWSYSDECKYNLRDKLDTENMENTPLKDFPDVVSCEFYEWFIFQ